MPNTPDCRIARKNSIRNTSTTSPYAHLSKAELIEIINADITAPLSRRDLYRCAMSAVCLWCDDVVAGNYASMIKLNDRLQAISDIYQHKR